MGISGEDRDLKRLRAICAALPNVVETSSWDHANWRTGKTLFASFEIYRGSKIFSFFAGNEHQDEFLEYERFSVHRLTDRYGWVCLKLDKDTDWNEIKQLAAFGHDLVVKNNAAKLGKPYVIERVEPKDLTVLVTGATAGFGAAVCRRFAQEGAKVIATGRRQDRLAALKKELGASCHTLSFDARDRAETEKAFSSLPPAFTPNVVVANAGLALGLEPAQRSDLDDWDGMIATNINGLLYTVRAALPGMVARDEGHVVLLGSVASDFPYPGGNVYGATKAFVKQFALNLRADLLGSNVRVTNIEPGLAETEFSLVRFKGDAAKAAKPYEGIAPLTAEDVAETIFWSCTLPRRVNVNRIQVMPVMQAFGPFAFKREA